MSKIRSLLVAVAAGVVAIAGCSSESPSPDSEARAEEPVGSTSQALSCTQWCSFRLGTGGYCENTSSRVLSTTSACERALLNAGCGSTAYEVYVSGANAFPHGGDGDVWFRSVCPLNNPNYDAIFTACNVSPYYAYRDCSTNGQGCCHPAAPSGYADIIWDPTCSSCMLR